MLITTCLVASAFVAGAWGQIHCQSFREAAVWHIYPAFTSLGPEYAATLNYSSLPDDVHGARKNTLTLRDQLDIYSPVFPNTSATGEDLWASLRAYMDDGYTLLGEFQDLAHSGVNYTQDDLDERRGKVLEWYAQWMAANASSDFATYINKAPFRAGDHTYSHTDESSFFWKHKLNRPTSSSVSGISAVRMLVLAQLDHIDAADAAIVQVRSILDDEAHEQFHDFRKSCRAVNDETSVFATDPVPLFSNTTGVQDALALLEDLYDQYGDVNDLWNKYAYYRDRHDGYNEEAARKDVEAAWDVLRAYQVAAGVAANMTNLRAGMTTDCARV